MRGVIVSIGVCCVIVFIGAFSWIVAWPRVIKLICGCCA